MIIRAKSFAEKMKSLFSNNKAEAIQAAKDFGNGMVVLEVDEKGNKQRIFTAPYSEDLGFEE